MYGQLIIQNGDLLLTRIQAANIGLEGTSREKQISGPRIIRGLIMVWPLDCKVMRATDIVARMAMIDEVLAEVLAVQYGEIEACYSM